MKPMSLLPGVDFGSHSALAHNMDAAGARVRGSTTNWDQTDLADDMFANEIIAFEARKFGGPNGSGWHDGPCGKTCHNFTTKANLCLQLKLGGKACYGFLAGTGPHPA